MHETFELQGHRGARGLFAENTLAGFVAAAAMGIDSIELDIAVTSDDVAVVVHDPLLNADLTRLHGAWLSGPGPTIRSLSLAALSQYDVGRARPGSRAALAHPEQQAFDGARIPSLAEVFAATALRIDAELKTDANYPERSVPPEAMAEIVVATAAASDALKRLAIRSFDWRGLAYLRRHHPDIPLAWLTDSGQGAGTPACVAAAARGCPYQPTWAPFHEVLDPELLADAHAHGLRVVPWTVNEARDMERLVGWGVDGFCTDRPDLFRGPRSENWR